MLKELESPTRFLILLTLQKYKVLTQKQLHMLVRPEHLLESSLLFLELREYLYSVLTTNGRYYFILDNGHRYLLAIQSDLERKMNAIPLPGA